MEKPEQESVEVLIFQRESQLDDTHVLIFRDKDGRQRYIEAASYHSLRLQPGQPVNARVREKGCAGNKIDEILDPFYEEGKVYRFVALRRVAVRQDGKVLSLLEIQDWQGRVFMIRVANGLLPETGEPLRCKLVSQQKGRLHFQFIPTMKE
jgi:hypothetical protein